MFYGHSHPELPESKWQTLEEHHKGVENLARKFARFGVPKTAALIGAIHDVGKRSDSFQARLRGIGGKVDHTSAAFQYLMEEWENSPPKGLGRIMAYLLAYPLLGHHGGMSDYGSQAEDGSLKFRLSGYRLRQVPDWKRGTFPELPSPSIFYQELQPFMCKKGNMADPFATAFLLRMLFSCLVDADFLDTERFCSPNKHALRQEWPSLSVLEERFFTQLQKKGFLSETKIALLDLMSMAASCSDTNVRATAIQKTRQYMLQQCLDASKEPTGIFSLTMPTGGGKTLSSMAFALRHARKHGLQRIILVVPYTSIIEQNAEVLRSVLGKDAVLEHHSNFIHPDESQGVGQDSCLAYKLSTENWDGTVIVTTSVQFFESLFDNRPSRCRKLHNIARSVVILDEVQMLPVPYVRPCLEVLQLLALRYGTSIVLCSATQPAFMRSPALDNGFLSDQIHQVVPFSSLPHIFKIFERVQIEQCALDDLDALASLIKAEEQVLCIVNSRARAYELFHRLEKSESDFHLSARMTPLHRSQVLNNIRERLNLGLTCRVVSTSLIECGVDISFPVVMREKNGLDVLAQSAGRCNREGKGGIGRVICFRVGEILPKRTPELVRRQQAFDEVSSHKELFSPTTVEKYFYNLYTSSKHLLDEKGILNRTKFRKGEPVFDFKSIAQQFKFIDEDTDMVVIENNEVNAILRDQEVSETLTPRMVRELQRHSVQVRRYELEQLKKDGRIEVRNGFLYVLAGGVGYNEKTGLEIKVEAGLPITDLMF